MSDVLLFHTADGGELEIIGGEPTMADGFLSAVYLSLFGGNEDDSGRTSDVRRQWWGNFSESDPAKRYRSETQNLLIALAPTSANLRKLEAAAAADCAWLTSGGYMREVRVAASLPSINELGLSVTLVTASGEQINLPRILQPWRKAA
jgi:phage gp46-like protein